MKTRVELTSREALYNIMKELPRRRREVLSLIYEYRSHGVTSFEIAEILKLSINQVTGRINELLHQQIIRIIGTRTSSKNRRNLYTIRWSDDPENTFKKSAEDRAKEMIFRIQIKLTTDQHTNIFIYDYVKHLNAVIDKLKKEYEL